MRNGKKEMADTTGFDVKCEILADVWMEYRDDEGFQTLIDFADIGFPLAYMLENGIVQSNEIAEGFIHDTFDLLLRMLKVSDTGFETLAGLLATAEQNSKSE